MSGKQISFADDELTTLQKPTNSERFLAEMDALMPRHALIDLAKSCQSKCIMVGRTSRSLVTIPKNYPSLQ